MAADPKGTKRITNPELLEVWATRGSQIPWAHLTPLDGRLHDWVVTHHLVTNPKHDMEGNLFRLPDSVHAAFHGGPGKLEAARKIRAHMTEAQIAYCVRRRSVAWLDKKYPREGENDE